MSRSFTQFVGELFIYSSGIVGGLHMAKEGFHWSYVIIGGLVYLIGSRMIDKVIEEAQESKEDK